MSETIVTGKKYRILTDVAQKVWQRVSFWTKSTDVEFNDAKTAETKVGAIDGITDSLSSNSSRIAASAKAVNQLNGDLKNKVSASDPTLIFNNVGSTGGKVEFRKSGSNPYALSLVYTNSSGADTFHSLVDSDGSRLWVTPYELEQVKNSFQAGVNTLYNKCVSCGVTPANQTPAVIANAIQVIHDNRYNEGYEDGQNASVPTRFSAKEVYRNSGWNDGNNYTSVFNSELYNKELYTSLLVAVREHYGTGGGTETTMNDVRYDPVTGEIFVDSVACHAEHITAYYI